MVKKKSAPGKKKKGLVIEFSLFSSLLWAGGFLFVLTWVFVLGFFVGRGFLPGKVTAFSDMKTRVRNIQSMVSRDEPVREQEREKREVDPQLAFYESLSSKKDEVKKQWQVPQKGETGNTQAPKLKASIPSPQARPDVEVTGKSSVREKPPGSSGPDLYFTIQLASVRDAKAAEELVNRLKRRGYPAYYREAEIKGQTYYRVRYGRYSTREEAEKYARGLEQKEGLKGFVATLD